MLAELSRSEAVHRERLARAERGECRYLVIERHGSLAGHCLLVLRQPEGWPDLRHFPQIVDMYIAMANRSQGLGSVFLEEIEHIAISMGCAELWLAVDPDENHRAWRFYNRKGYSSPHRQHSPQGTTYSNGSSRMCGDMLVYMVKRLEASGGE